MKVKLLTIYANPTASYTKGDIINVSDKEAKELISGGYALEVPEEKLTKQVKTERVKKIVEDENTIAKPKKLPSDGEQIVRRRRKTS